ncbi:leucine-rich repeat protein [Skeletonema marinoi]|uniref:Leucine-rich repeat protein n=1 Tax=Skeletonema marinoi TaxID=267567 RepID=A0AAD8XUU7_9STRA|nr:leucine-rich repeat protein [Skeletonema marinoi]
MDDATFTPDTAAMNRRRLLEQLAIIRSLFCKESSADDDAATAAARNRNVVEGRAKEGVRLINDQMTAVSTELLLTVMSDMMLLRLLDGLGLEEGRAVPSSNAASDQQLMLMDAVTSEKKKKKKRAAAAAAKKKRYKRNKAAAKHKKIKLMSWLGGGLISLIMMIAFGSITMLIFPFSLIHQSDGSGEGEAPPALPPSASKSLRQKDHRSNYDESVSSDMDIISPLPAVGVVPLSILSPTSVGNRRMKSDEELRASPACLDTPGWTDKSGDGCDWLFYCPYACTSAGNLGPASEHCCFCEGGSRTCEDFRSKCQKYINVEGLGFEDGVVAPLCKRAESCSCEGVDHDFKIVTDMYSSVTLGLHNECKCDFWSRLCEDTGVGEACDYAAEYCCGDYKLKFIYGWDTIGKFDSLNSPACYCDFFNYAQNELGHSLKPKALNISEEFESPCGQPWIGNSEDERTSLEAIYKGTNGQNWTNNAGWMDDIDPCQWYGISCNGDGLVTSIDLRGNNLAGQFPVYTRNTDYLGNPVQENDWKWSKYGVANLYNLETLNLANNRLTGTIESWPLYTLASLTRFDVSGNQLSGDVDALITSSVTHADFSNNRFTSIQSFKKYKPSFQTLSFCDVSNNAIQNNATDLLHNIPPNIEEFFSSNNQFYGSLSSSLNNLPQLLRFNMSSNALSGSLPESFNNLPKLRQFDMSSNALSGELPDFADSLLSLQELDMSNQTNGLTGSIPENLWGFQYLKIMNLAGNKLAGTIPPMIGDMAVLEVLDLSDNLLESSIPSDLGNGNLKRLDLSNNGLTGTIPSQIGQLQGATILLKGNLFEDKTAPFSLCMLHRVEAFDLANNTTFCPFAVERNALSDFYDSTKGAEWTDRTKWLDEDEDASYCNWKGVTCEENRVTKLNLSNNDLSGRLSESIGNLTFIEELDLSDNDIKGSIPREIGLLSKLTYLRLTYNAFTGLIPEELGALQSLKTINLAGNDLSGSLPEDLCMLRNVKEFDLTNNSTYCPTERNALVDLYNSANGAEWTDRTNWLDLDGDADEYASICKWKGVTCDDMNQHVTELNLANNGLSGRLSESIGNLPFVEVLDLSDNDIKGSIPAQIGLLSNLTHVRLSNNDFIGTAPRSLCMLRSVEAFDLAQDMAFCPIERNALIEFYDSTKGANWTNRTNWLDGDEDEYASYCNWKGVTCDDTNRVTELNLTNNSLSGGLSKSIGDLAFIEVLDLSDNDIKGSIPTEIGLLSKLTHLRLSSNSFNGPIPEDLGRFLKTMNLAGNELTGLIPEDLGRFQSLKILNLAGNKLSGAIPPTIGDMTVLEVLELSSNSLSDQIPFQIGQLEGTLNHLDLSNNTLSGTIPSQIGLLQGASILLKDNLFEDKTSPLGLCMLHGVEAFDLAQDIKFCPIERNALSDFYDSAKGAEWTDRTNWLDGNEYASYCEWDGVTCDDTNQHVTELNLSNNGLSGRLSKSIGNLKFIEVLDLSDNDIKGSIPTEIGNLTNLTYLRLSYNAFTGAAPEGLGELAQLQLLQLQTNRITKIPNIPQLDENKYPIAYEVAATTNSNEDVITVPILLLNGFGVGSFHQHRLMRQLLVKQQNQQSKKRYVIYGIDYLGQGKSWPKDPQDGNSADEYQLGYSADMWLDQLASFVQEVVISPATDNEDSTTTATTTSNSIINNKVHLVGNSVGGYLATILTHKHPQLISSLTLLNATPVWGLNLPGWDGKLPAPAVPKAIGRQMFNLIRNEDVIRQYLEAAGYHPYLGRQALYLNSPTCYCDFVNYAQNEFGHTLKTKALNTTYSKEEEFVESCEDIWSTDIQDERTSLEAIYKGTNGQNWTNNDGWMNETLDYCEWYGISCDGDKRVTDIDLRDNNLAGQFPVYTRGLSVDEHLWKWSKYGLANLYSLKTLDLADNRLTGTIEYPPLYNLHSLTHFDVSGNLLSGEVNALVSPSLTYADFSNNRFTSMRRFEKYKGSFQTLRFCDVSNNTIQTNVTDIFGNIPTNIVQFVASNNQFIGSLPASLNNLPQLLRFNMSSNALSGSLPESFNNLPKLRQFDMSSNALSGSLPNFAGSISSLQELDMSNQTNGLTGSIPENLWGFQYLRIMNLAGNKLAGTIPPMIGDTTVLEVLELSSNSLSGQIPFQIGQLEDNGLTGMIPSQLGQLQGASVILEGNLFDNKTAPLSLCVLSSVEAFAFDLANDTSFCPPERNALNDIYDSAKGAEWTDRTNWLGGDEYTSYCDWKGVTCNEKNRVTELNLANNGLSGRLSESIGNLTFIEVLDLSDNDIKGSIPAQIGLLPDLTYLRLSYNAFTGAAPESLGELKQLQLLQLQTNRITKIPNIPQLDESQGKSWPKDPQDGNSADEYQLGYSADMWLDQLASFVQEVVISPATDNDDSTTTATTTSNSINNNKKVHLVGNSVGGYLATILTHKHPQLISSLTLLNATPVWGLNLPGWDGKLPAPAVPKAIARQMFNLIRNEDVIRQYLEAAYVRGEAFDGSFEDGGLPLGAKIRACTEGNGGHAAFASILWSAPASGISFYEALQQVPVDVLLLFGGDDPWCTEAVGKRMHVTLASRRDGEACRFVTLKNVGHCPNHEAPTAVAQVLMPWLDADDSEERRVVPLDSVSQIQEPWGEVVIREVSIEESESLGLVDRVVSSMVG